MTTILIVLLVLWALGWSGGYAFGGLIHLLLLCALIVFILDLIMRRRPLD